ncbi:FxSxx-COOH system tetratricopeptide repeat protein [Kribbella sp. NPDC056861]|uniref:FxSxx-COOH system tetratricopeptide repeat protein n=1 Tax=Kribbella sp. NPDC056861 TaxID=3154857 RepID=UPI003438414F
MNLSTDIIPKDWKWSQNPTVVWSITGAICVGALILGFFPRRDQNPSGANQIVNDGISGLITGQAVASSGGLAVGNSSVGNIAYNANSGSGDINVHLPPATPPLPNVRFGDIPIEPSTPIARPQAKTVADFFAASRATTKVCVVAGGPGVGKTQIAADYARQRAEQDYKTVAWLPGEEQQSFIAAMSALAVKSGVAEPNQLKSEDAAKALRDILAASTEKVLLIIDNGEDPDFIRNWIPATGNIEVIITTTNRDFSTFGDLIEIDSYSRDQSKEYLKGVTGLPSDKNTELIAEIFGDHPLALSQAAAVIKRQNISYAEYVTKLGARSLAENLPRLAGDPYPRETVAAIEIAVETAAPASRYPFAREMIQTIAILSADGFTSQIAVDLCKVTLPDDGSYNPDSATQMLVELASLSVLTWSADDGTLLMHRLVGRALRDSSNKNGSLEATIRTLSDAITKKIPPNEESWDQRHMGNELVSHSLSMWSHLASGPLVAAATYEACASAVIESIRFLLSISDVSRAAVVAEGIQDDLRERIGEKSSTYLSLANILASIYQRMGMYDASSELQRFCYEQTLASLGAEHNDTLTVRTNLGITYMKIGLTAEAIPIHEETLRIRMEKFGGDDLDTLISRNCLAGAYHNAGELKRARPLYEEVYQRRSSILGPGDPRTINVARNLSELLITEGYPSDAVRLVEPLLRHVLEKRDADDPSVILTQHSLANAYSAAGRSSESSALHKKTFEQRLRLSGLHDPETVNSAIQMARVDAARGWRKRRTARKFLAEIEVALDPQLAHGYFLATKVRATQDELAQRGSLLRIFGRQRQKRG